jgi:hypothetical protein
MMVQTVLTIVPTQIKGFKLKKPHTKVGAEIIEWPTYPFPVR